MSFLAHEENGLLIKTSTVLSGVRHGFSTRTGGVSPAPWDSLNLGVGRGDDMDRVRENYRRFCAVLGTDEHRAVLSKQVHEDNVRHVTAEDCGKAFPCAVAFTAAADLAAARGGEGVSGFTAGSVSVRIRGAAESCALAESLRRTAERLMAPFAVPDDFCFRGVRG